MMGGAIPCQELLSYAYPEPPFKFRLHAKTWKMDCGGGGRGHMSSDLLVPLPKVATLNTCPFMLLTLILSVLFTCWGQEAGPGWLELPGSDPNSGDIFLKTFHIQQGLACTCAMLQRSPLEEWLPKPAAPFQRGETGVSP